MYTDQIEFEVHVRNELVRQGVSASQAASIADWMRWEVEEEDEGRLVKGDLVVVIEPLKASPGAGGGWSREDLQVATVKDDIGVIGSIAPQPCHQPIAPALLKAA